MKSEKIITHVIIDINPDCIKEVLSGAKVTRDKIMVEEGCEVFNLTIKKDNPFTLVVFAVYTSEKTYQWHLKQDYVKSFFKFLEDKLFAAPLVTYLEEV
ncbi:antibiotic biosynthesis monooxygenase [Pedobacter sp. PF22-3]|uniref:putative quinol monooxygenase n=1 Tax=Pedobacter sp. PF22-3 TaxID=2994467 RepID=UPI002245FC85|nr:antibiotic biosynthesis monooxygenase [Pedobacter sp. PF22-3]MCX2492843.1 antibiotic biosynthesis monooxygenase [Pedobacter sp. PF22-3]